MCRPFSLSGQGQSGVPELWASAKQGDGEPCLWPVQEASLVQEHPTRTNQRLDVYQYMTLSNTLLVSQGRSPLHHNAIVLAIRNRPPIFHLENLLLKSGRRVSPGRSTKKSLVAFHCSANRMAITPKPTVGRVNRDLVLLSSRPKRWLGVVYSPPQEVLPY